MQRLVGLSCITDGWCGYCSVRLLLRGGLAADARGGVLRSAYQGAGGYVGTPGEYFSDCEKGGFIFRFSYVFLNKGVLSGSHCWFGFSAVGCRGHFRYVQFFRKVFVAGRRWNLIFW